MITAILLAAGEGSRMGVQKQLLFWGKKNILEESISPLMNLKHIDEIRVVLGHNAKKVKESLTSYDNNIKVLINPDYKNGMHTTIRKGLENLPQNTKYLLIALGDQPLIEKDIHEKIIKKFLETDKKFLIPTYQGENGHPVIIERNFLEKQIDDISGQGGLRSLIKKFPEDIYFYELEKKEIIIDLDYYDEYKKYKKKKAVDNDRFFLNYKFWLEKEEKVFGDGPCDILVRVDRFGSLKKASEDINMSYSQAWKLINKMEERLGFPLIDKKTGGRSGGGSELTKKGRKLMNDFLAFRREIHEHIIRLENKHFKDWK